MPRSYIRLCRNLYENQKGVVQTQVDGRHVDTSRGTKQGDPMSPKLFNAVLQKVFGPLLEKWGAEDSGWQVKKEIRMTNLRCADDVLLVAKSAGELESMLNDLAGAA